MEYLLDKLPVSPVIRDIVGAFAIVLLTLVIAHVFKRVLDAFVSRLTRQTQSDLDDRLFAATGRWIYAFLYVFGFTILLNYLERRLVETVGEAIFRAADGLTFAVGVFLVAVIFVRVTSTVLTWYRETIAVRTETTVDDEFLPLIDRTTKIVVYALALLIVLDHFEVDIKGLVAVLGVGSLAVGLAAQDTLANMISGFVIMLDRPFRVGDRVRLSDGTLCIVHEIGIRSSKFRTFDNTLIIVPNAELTKTTIHNVTYPHPQVRVRVDVGVGYDSDMNKVREVMLDEARQHPKVLSHPAPVFAFLSFGDSSLDVALFCYVDRVEDQWMTGNELRERILNRFRAEGIEIPFPQRVVTINPPDQAPPV